MIFAVFGTVGIIGAFKEKYYKSLYINNLGCFTFEINYRITVLQLDFKGGLLTLYIYN